MKAFMTFQHGDQPLGTLYLDLEPKIVPKTVRNFETFLQKGYKGTHVHRLIKGFMLQAGDITAGDGTGGYSIYGKTFADENFVLPHDRPGRLSMANAGPHTNGSQFFITFKPTPHLDGKHVVFGSVDLQKSGSLLKMLEQIKTLSSDKPKQALTIVDCGIIEGDDSVKTSEVVGTADADEIDLEEENDTGNDVAEDSIEEEEDSKPLSKPEELKRRLRKLKQRVNQARQLNKQAVKDEGERSTVKGSASARKKLAATSKQEKSATWAQQNAKALSIADESGVEAKVLTEQAADSVSKARVAAERAEPQPHKYLRDLKTVPRGLPQPQEMGISTYNPLQNEVNPDKEREGARRLAMEMHKRVEKNTKRLLLSGKRKNDEGGEVSYINKRNKIFNEKISRDYDKHTAEIRESLERGSAL